uniref:Uncharacterized protein n=1 Tax=Arundo donax TaxID=35708 RepID=A0A0A9G9G9_ARUDO
MLGRAAATGAQHPIASFSACTSPSSAALIRSPLTTSASSTSSNAVSSSTATFTTDGRSLPFVPDDDDDDDGFLPMSSSSSSIPNAYTSVLALHLFIVCSSGALYPSPFAAASTASAAAGTSSRSTAYSASRATNSSSTTTFDDRTLPCASPCPACRYASARAAPSAILCRRGHVSAGRPAEGSPPPPCRSSCSVLLRGK